MATKNGKSKPEAVKTSALTPAKDNLPVVTSEPTKAELDQMYGDLGRDHVSIPRLVVLESLSPEVRDKQGQAGEFFIKGMNQALGVDPIEVVVLMRSHSRMAWKPISEGGGILCQAVDGKKGVGTPGGDCSQCPGKDWGTDDKGKPIKPACDLYENFIVVLRKDLAAGEAFPMAISGARARLKGLKDFNTMLMQSLQKRRPLFAKSYLIKPIQKTNSKIPGSMYYVFQIVPGNDNQVLPDQEQAEAYNMFKSFAGKTITIDQEVPEEGPAAPSAEAQGY